jgi:hypothetical protein
LGATSDDVLGDLAAAADLDEMLIAGFLRNEGRRDGGSARRWTLEVPAEAEVCAGRGVTTLGGLRTRKGLSETTRDFIRWPVVSGVSC